MVATDGPHLQQIATAFRCDGDKNNKGGPTKRASARRGDMPDMLSITQTRTIAALAGATLLLGGCSSGHRSLFTEGGKNFKSGIDSATETIAGYHKSVPEQRRMTGVHAYIRGSGNPVGNIESKKLDMSFARFVCTGLDTPSKELAVLNAAKTFAKEFEKITEAPKSDAGIVERIGIIRKLNDKKLKPLEIVYPDAQNSFKKCLKLVAKDLKQAGTILNKGQAEGLVAAAGAAFAAFETLKSVYQAVDTALSTAGKLAEESVRIKKAKAYIALVKSPTIDPNSDGFDASKLPCSPLPNKTAAKMDFILYCAIKLKSLENLHTAKRSAALVAPHSLFTAMLKIDKAKHPEKIVALAQKAHQALGPYDLLRSSGAPKPDVVFKVAREAWSDLRRFEEGDLTLDEWFNVMAGYKEAFDSLKSSWDAVKEAEEKARAAIGSIAASAP